MTLSLALALAVLEILGIGVGPLEEGSVVALGPEALIVGDVVGDGGGYPLVSWCGSPPPPAVDARCFLTEVHPGAASGRVHRRVFQVPTLCGASRLRLAAMAGGVAGTLRCSDRPGFWAWAQIYGRGGEVRTVPLPVAPVSGFDQNAPVPVPGGDAGAWVVWKEGARGRGTVRAIRLDSEGEPAGEALDLSHPGAAIGSTVTSQLGAAGLPGGGFAVLWPEKHGEEIAVRLGIFDRAGRPVAPPIDLGAATLRPFEPLRIAADGAGRITAAWWREEPGGGARLHAASFSPRGEPLVEPVSVARLPTGVFPRIAALAARDGAQLLAWNDRDPDTGEPRIALRRWSPELGPLGLTSWIAGTVTDSWPFLEVVPGDAAGRFTLYWKETVDDPDGGLTAVLRWRDLAAAPPPTPAGSRRPSRR